MPRSDMKSCKMRSLPSASLNLHKLMITHVAKAKFPKFLRYGNNKSTPDSSIFADSLCI